jgi:ribosomal protein S17E
MAYLFGKDRLAQSLRLGLAGAWHQNYPQLSHQLMSLLGSCPSLIESFMSPNEYDENKHKLMNIVPSESSSAGKVDIKAFGQDNSLAQTLRYLKIDIPSGYIQNHSQRVFADKLKQIYRDDFNSNFSNNLYVTRLVANVQFKDR